MYVNMSLCISRTVGVAVVLTFYLRKKNAPIPTWRRGTGFMVKWFPVHKMFAVSYLS